MIKGVEIQTLLSCRLPERNFFFTASPLLQMPSFVEECVCCALRHIRIMVSEKCIHSLIIQIQQCHRLECVVITFSRRHSVENSHTYFLRCVFPGCRYCKKINIFFVEILNFSMFRVCMTSCRHFRVLNSKYAWLYDRYC